MDPKIPYKLTFILPLTAMLTKEPEMLQPDAFCEHTMQQNAIAAGDPLGEITALLQTLAGFKGAGRGGREGKGKKRRGKEKEGRCREGREGGG